MHRVLKSVSVRGIACLLLGTPVLLSGTTPHNSNISAKSPVKSTVTVRSSLALLREEAHEMYESMTLSEYGLSKSAFELAWRGYRYMENRGLLNNPGILSICDFSQSSKRKRLYVIDIREKKILINTYVAHGKRSGGEFARSFSNNPESHKSSLGFYITRETYYGDHGLSLQLTGLERGINDKAGKRRIVIHGSEYVGTDFLQHNPFNGRSFGCPAIPEQDISDVIDIIKGGSCLFIYHPSKHYLSASRILNG